jgi:hypothetical protein
MVRRGRNRPTPRRRSLAFAGVLALVAVLTASACAPTKKGAPGPRIMLVGDSIAHSVQGYVALEVARRGWAFEPSAQQGCSIVRGVSSDFFGTPPPQAAFACDQAMWGVHEDKVDAFRPSVVLWFSFIEEWGRYVDNHWFAPGPWPLPLEPRYEGATGGTSFAGGDAKILELIEEKRAQFTQHGAKLVFVTMPPPVHPDAFPDHGPRVVHLNNLLKQFVVNHPADTALIDLASIACPPAGQQCSHIIAGINMRPDLYHFNNPQGAEWVAARIVERL